MPEYAPLTKEKRELYALCAEEELAHPETGYGEGDYYPWLEKYLRLNATVAALEAEVARLRPLAETGERAEGMPVGFGLSHAAEKLWLIWDGQGWDDLDETCGESALAALEALAAMRAAKESDAG